MLVRTTIRTARKLDSMLRYKFINLNLVSMSDRSIGSFSTRYQIKLKYQSGRYLTHFFGAARTRGPRTSRRSQSNFAFPHQLLIRSEETGADRVDNENDAMIGKEDLISVLVQLGKMILFDVAYIPVSLKSIQNSAFV